MKTIYLLVILFFVLPVRGQLLEPQLAVDTADDERLIYDTENGICSGDGEIYLCCWRVIPGISNWQLGLEFHYSFDDATNFGEVVLEEYTIASKDLYLMQELEMAPVMYKSEEGVIYVIYTDPETLEIKLGITEDGGASFEVETLAGVMPGSQLIPVVTEAGLYLAGTGMERITMPLSNITYVTKHEYSENDEYNDNDAIKFWGPDVLSGMVYSNDDIWIAQIGGGANMSWSTFHAPVYCGGRIIDYATQQPAINSAPMHMIFQGGFRESCATVDFPVMAEEIRENGIWLEESSEHDVLLVQMEGDAAVLRYGDWSVHLDTFTVYNSFPDAANTQFPVGDSIWTNYIDVKEFNWSDETSTLNFEGSSYFVQCDLWIEGSVGADVTFGCSDSVFITGDIIYSDIAGGDMPDESEYIFGIVSEEKIIIKYKWKDWEGVVHDSNCDDVYLYGCYAAIGDGDIDLYGNMNTHYEGSITYEYQHPHGSTPAYEIELPNGDIWEVEYPDFHKYIFPISPYWTGDEGFQMHSNIPNGPGFYACGYPYEVPDYGEPYVAPYGTDYPWYNPIWPESKLDIIGERGAINLYGDFHQYRRGFVHRSGTDPYNHEDPFVWDIEHWQYGGPHGSTGYDKNYQIDSRLNDEYYPVDYLTLEISSLGYNPFWRHNHLSLYAVDLANAEAEEIIDIIPVENDFRVIDWCRSGAEFSLLCFCGDYFIMHYAEGEFEQIALSGLSEGYDQIEMINGQWLVKSANNLVLLNEEGELEEVFDPGETELQDFSGGEENLHYIFNLITLDYTIYSENEPGELVELTNYDILNFDPDLLNPDNSSLESYYQETTMVMQLLLKFPSEEELPDFYGSIYLASDEVDLEVVKTQEDQLVEAIEYGIYPNPFNAETTISFCLPEPQKVEISVYNLKGQKVAELAEENYEAGDHQLEWKAENCSSGIYLVEYRFDDKLEKQAKVTLLK